MINEQSIVASIAFNILHFTDQQPINALLRPPSVRPSSARPGAPRLRPDSALPLKEMITLGKINVIVENFDKGDEENETVVVESTVDVELSDVPTEINLNIPSDKGQLVEQILEQITDSESGELKYTNDQEKEGKFKFSTLMGSSSSLSHQSCG